MAGLARAMTTRAERQRERIARLLHQAMSAAEAWSRSEYEAGLQDGGLGTGTARSEATRAAAERRYRDVIARLGAAVTPADDTPRLRLQ
jgi:hypothetical protein